MNEAELRLEYDKRSDLFNDVLREAEFSLRRRLDDTIKIHSITGRIKSFESFIAKVARRRPADLGGSIDDIYDIVGLRVVCLFLSDIERVAEAVRDAFEIESEDNKIESGLVSAFGYMSLHFVARMKSSYTGPRYDRIRERCVEIQVRTIAMDAWANVSHYLHYKSETDIPESLRRDFYALSGLFYVADKHFEMFFRAADAVRDEMRDLFDTDRVQAGAQPINLDSLTTYMASKMPDRATPPEGLASDLVTQLLESGYRTVGQVDAAVSRAWKAFLEYERHHSRSNWFARVAAVRGALEISDPDFHRLSYRNYPEFFPLADSAMQYYRSRISAA